MKDTLKDFIQLCHECPTFAFGLMTAASGAAVGLTNEAGMVPGGIVLIFGIAISLYGLTETPIHPQSP
ncbi:MAG TPA: hypothetical protein VJ327_08170 [Patescibacteria group bacterium]|nr:hypothetical protein [Patescibacteria group bacterium]